jgi:hypothetical protein
MHLGQRTISEVGYFNSDAVNRLLHIDVRRRASMRGRRYFSRMALCCAIGSLFVLPAPVQAGCQEQLQQLSTDLRGRALTQTQKQTIGGMIDDARRYCWVHREMPAMEIIAKARRVAGLKPAGAEFDWETVPLESLEQKN